MAAVPIHTLHMSDVSKVPNEQMLRGVSTPASAAMSAGYE